MLTFHEARNEMTLDLQKSMEKVVNRKKSDPNYYILIAAQVDNWNSDVINNKIILLKEKDKPKVPMIGTILYHVDNNKGELVRIWVFPRDVIQPDMTINKVGDFSDEIFHMGEAPNK